jgi:hypothetical protein
LWPEVSGLEFENQEFSIFSNASWSGINWLSCNRCLENLEISPIFLDSDLRTVFVRDWIHPSFRTCHYIGSTISILILITNNILEKSGPGSLLYPPSRP